MTHNYLRLAAVIHLYVRRPQTAAKRPEAVAMTKQMSTAANLLGVLGVPFGLARLGLPQIQKR
jgi:hypothetical protein